MIPKTKPVAFSSSVVAPEVQMGGSSTQEAPILGNTTELASAIKELKELS